MHEVLHQEDRRRPRPRRGEARVDEVRPKRRLAGGRAIGHGEQLQLMGLRREEAVVHLHVHAGRVDQGRAVVVGPVLDLEAELPEAPPPDERQAAPGRGAGARRAGPSGRRARRGGRPSRPAAPPDGSARPRPRATGARSRRRRRSRRCGAGSGRTTPRCPPRPRTTCAGSAPRDLDGQLLVLRLHPGHRVVDGREVEVARCRLEVEPARPDDEAVHVVEVAVAGEAYARSGLVPRAEEVDAAGRLVRHLGASVGRPSVGRPSVGRPGVLRRAAVGGRGPVVAWAEAAVETRVEVFGGRRSRVRGRGSAGEEEEEGGRGDAEASRASRDGAASRQAGSLPGPAVGLRRGDLGVQEALGGVVARHLPDVLGGTRSRARQGAKAMYS